jgi:hypothetical protein
VPRVHIPGIGWTGVISMWCASSLLDGDAQALGSRARSLPPNADVPSPAARTEFQPLSLEASLSFPEDVNRAKWLLY